MYFRVLGPLEALDDGKLVPLGGHRQKATLGLMLLHANRVIATSEFLEGLWGAEEAPLTARKVLQNAVRSLRVLFDENGGATGVPTLLTCAPGYLLRVEPKAVDLFRFHDLAERGRAELSTGDAEVAAETLRAGLALWRGRALADLVEAGYEWAELTALQNVRLDVMEDYFEAKLAAGHHQAVVGELEAIVAAEPLRERLCHQLMLALYRSGRQADALEIYSRVRSTLVEQLGLEPGRDLRALQHGILDHDPALAVPAGTRREREISWHAADAEPAKRPSLPAPSLRGEVNERAAWLGAAERYKFGRLPVQHQRSERHRSLVPLAALPVGPREAWQETRRHKQISAVMIRVDVGAGGRAAEVDAILDSVAVTVREDVERYGGTIASSMGSVSLALFRSASPRENGAERAVRAALSFRDRVCSFEVSRAGRPTLRVAVATGEMPAYPGTDGSNASLVNAALLVDCESLLESAGATEIVVCGRTHRLTSPGIAYGKDGDFHGGRPKWRVRGELVPGARLFDREPELDVLDSLLERVHHRARPHLVTVLGSPGIGKSRLLSSFESRVAGAATVGPVLTARTPLSATCWILCREILFTCCAIERDDSPELAKGKLDRVVSRVAKGRDAADRMLSRLSRFIEPRVPVIAQDVHDAVVRDWWAIVAKVAEHRPLVVFADDLHLADNVLLDFVEDLLNPPGSMPLLVVTAASPELFQRRPEWGAGKLPATTMTLDPLTEVREGVLSRSHAERCGQLGDAAS